LRKGDLLIVEGNGSKHQIGRVAIWNGSIEQCVHQNHIIKVRLVDEGMGTWILSWLLSPPGREHIESVSSSTTGLYTLSITKVGDLPIPLPPSDEQGEIVREVSRRMTARDRLAATLDQQVARARAMRQSLLRQAFAGRLISQDPTDEPASVFLGRLRIARETEARKLRGKGMKRSISKSSIERRPLVDVLHEHKKPITPEELFRAAGFEPSQVAEFYRELSSMRDKLREQKPKASEAKAWPLRAHVFLQLKKGVAK
jgi:type I restriction enzyme S subunit